METVLSFSVGWWWKHYLVSNKKDTPRRNLGDIMCLDVFNVILEYSGDFYDVMTLSSTCKSAQKWFQESHGYIAHRTITERIKLMIRPTWTERFLYSHELKVHRHRVITDMYTCASDQGVKVFRYACEYLESICPRFDVNLTHIKTDKYLDLIRADNLDCILYLRDIGEGWISFDWYLQRKVFREGAFKIAKWLWDKKYIEKVQDQCILIAESGNLEMFVWWYEITYMSCFSVDMFEAWGIALAYHKFEIADFIVCKIGSPGPKAIAQLRWNFECKGDKIVIEYMKKKRFITEDGAVRKLN